MPVFECRSLTKRYGRNAALTDVSMSLPAGRVVGLLGPNGSGKTTLIKLAAGLLTPSAGEILICDKPVGEETKALVSYLPERTYFSNDLTVRATVDFFSDFYADFDRTRACELLSRLRVPFDSRIRTLSKGTKEKMQLVLVMSRHAKLYLLDEPIGGVDPATRDFILHTIISNRDPEATVLISTHLIADVEEVLDEFMFIDAGRIVGCSTVAELRESRGISVDRLFREVFRC